MELTEALAALEADPSPEHTSRALGQLVHDLNTQLGALVFATDTVGRMGKILAELGRRRQDETLSKGAARLDSTSVALEASFAEIQRILRAVAETADNLR